MGKVRTLKGPPEGSLVARRARGGFDYLDCFAVEVDGAQGRSIDHLAALVFTSLPRWSRSLMRLRDALVAPLGLRTGMVPEPSSLDPHRRYEVGERAVFFTVDERSENEIVMAEDDAHLFFLVSVAAEDRGASRDIRLTTVVRFHNRLGRLYFAVVKPFHRLLVHRLLTNFAGRF